MFFVTPGDNLQAGTSPVVKTLRPDPTIAKKRKNALFTVDLTQVYGNVLGWSAIKRWKPPFWSQDW